MKRDKERDRGEREEGRGGRECASERNREGNG